MTQSEMREQKVRLTLELEDAESHLNALRVRAETHGDILVKLGASLREKPETLFRHGLSAHYGHPLEKLTFIEDTMVNALNIQKIVEETNEIRKEAETVKTLKERLAKLG
jgi:ubiquinone biosynthesis protein UbiJ